MERQVRYYSEIPILRFHLRETLKYVSKETCTDVLCSSVYDGQKFKTAPLSILRRINQVRCTYPVKYYAAVDMTARATCVECGAIHLTKHAEELGELQNPPTIKLLA